jgi:hypothetical protein
MKHSPAPAQQSLAGSLIPILANPDLRKTALRSTASIFYHFFFLQYRAALFPRKTRVSPVDHPLDKEIPFRPWQAGTYLDFTAFWIRCAGFLVSRYGRRAIGAAGEFIVSIGRLYSFAAEVYSRNLSTTARPRYFRHPRFALIHTVDPHLMCVPSLHVMLVIRSYTAFRAHVRALGGESRFAAQIESCRRWALDITDAVLYVKQHSVNCVSAAMYAMTRFDPLLFPPDEAEAFAAALFTNPFAPQAREAIREYIAVLYRRFLDQGKTAKDWAEPLLAFLAGCYEQTA